MIGICESADTHLEQPSDGARRVIRVQRRKHHVAGLGSLEGDLGGLGIPNLAHHHDVRVLAQDRTQARGKSHPRLVRHGHLIDPFQPVLDGILDRDDVRGFGPHEVQRRVQRRRLGAPGRSRHQHDALRTLQKDLVQ